MCSWSSHKSQLAPGGGDQCRSVLQARTGLARLLEECRRFRRAAAYSVDAAPRASRPGRCSFPRPSVCRFGPLMDFGYENEVLFPFTVGRCKNREARPGRPPCQSRLAGLPRSLHSGQSGVGSRTSTDRPATPAVTSRSRPGAELWERFAGRLAAKRLPASDTAVFQPTPRRLSPRRHHRPARNASRFFP